MPEKRRAHIEFHPSLSLAIIMVIEEMLKQGQMCTNKEITRMLIENYCPGISAYESWTLHRRVMSCTRKFLKQGLIEKRLIPHDKKLTQYEFTHINRPKITVK